MKAMTRVETIIEQMKTLEPREIAELSAKVHEVEAEAGSLTNEERRARFKALQGSLTDREADAMLAVIEREFERVDEPAQ